MFSFNHCFRFSTKIYFGKILSVEDLFNLRKKIVGVLPRLNELKFNNEYDFHDRETINDFITNLLHLFTENNGKKLSIKTQHLILEKHLAQ